MGDFGVWLGCLLIVCFVLGELTGGGVREVFSLLVCEG